RGNELSFVLEPFSGLVERRAGRQQRRQARLKLRVPVNARDERGGGRRRCGGRGGLVSVPLVVARRMRGWSRLRRRGLRRRPPSAPRVPMLRECRSAEPQQHRNDGCKTQQWMSHSKITSTARKATSVPMQFPLFANIPNRREFW